jgi:uncharacterized protein (DUF2267 family)
MREMGWTGIAEFDGAEAKSGNWLFALEERLGWQDRRKVFLALLGTLHALRDSLPLDEAVYLGAELPALLRGLYYEGWHPRQQPMPLKDRDAFLNRVHEAVHRDPGIDAEHVVRTVFAVLSERISAPEFEDVRAASPQPLHGLWPH